jgi:hypothetical protein
VTASKALLDKPKNSGERMLRLKHLMLAGAILVQPAVGITQNGSENAALAASVEQLRNAVGEWAVVTEFLNEDGTVAKTVNGTYQFEWVIVDRVLSGKSEIPEMKQSSGILFYVNEKRKMLEMVSVGQDGYLWVMAGPLGEEVRYSQKFKTQDGGESQLRFTRFNVSSDGFESKMEYTDDDGKSWKPGNHQVFRRKR